VSQLVSHGLPGAFRDGAGCLPGVGGLEEGEMTCHCFQELLADESHGYFLCQKTVTRGATLDIQYIVHQSRKS